MRLQMRVPVVFCMAAGAFCFSLSGCSGSRSDKTVEGFWRSDSAQNIGYQVVIAFESDSSGVILVCPKVMFWFDYTSTGEDRKLELFPTPSPFLFPPLMTDIDDKQQWQASGEYADKQWERNRRSMKLRNAMGDIETKQGIVGLESREGNWTFLYNKLARDDLRESAVSIDCVLVGDDRLTLKLADGKDVVLRRVDTDCDVVIHPRQ